MDKKMAQIKVKQLWSKIKCLQKQNRVALLAQKEIGFAPLTLTAPGRAGPLVHLLMVWTPPHGIAVPR